MFSFEFHHIVYCKMPMCFDNTITATFLVGGVAQWLGRRSLAGKFSPIYAWSIVDMRPLRG